MKIQTKKICIAGLCLAMCMLLPFLTGQIPKIGNALSPMHIPVLICGLLCGPVLGAIIGFTAPLIRFLIFGMPPIFPIGIAMAFELMAYGMISGIIYSNLTKKTSNIYVALISAMIIGRIVWGITRFIMAIAFGVEFSFQIFMSGAFITAIPGIIIHILIIPPIVIACQKADSILESNKSKLGNTN